VIFALALAAATVPVAVVNAVAPPSTSTRTIQIGTEVSLILLDDLSSKTSPKGTPFDLEVAEEVVKDGQVLIPAGTRAVGEVTRSDPKGAFGKSGKLEAAIMYIVLDGKPVRMSGRLGAAGEGGTTETVLTAVAAGLLAFAVTGKSATIPKGTRLRAFLNRTVRIAD
jgi:hypothetical protein